MKLAGRFCTLILLLPMLGVLFPSGPSVARNSGSPSQSSVLPSETPANFNPVTSSFNYTRRDVMIPMRDGVKLHTVILIPKDAKDAPILLTRTPYDATKLTSHEASAHLGPTLQGYDNATDVIVEDGYIRVVQDIRGKYGSQGDFVMNRPLHGPLNPTPVDESTDTYDTIDWLVKHVPESNGKVGILGISYNGFLTLMALVHPHPALKVAVPMNPMVDGWMGDDWFHNGAFREQMMPYIYDQESSRGNDFNWWTSDYDDYDTYLQAVSAGPLGRSRGMEQLGFWRKILAHPSYDSFWKEQAVDKILAAQPLKVPTMLVDSLWDQEDIYGAIAVYKAIKPKDTHNDKVFLVMGPWHHGQEIENGSSLGALKFNSDTGYYFRQKVLRPFLAQYLKDGAPKADIAPVTAFETGTNRWQHLPSWPAGCASGCTVQPTPLYLEKGLKAGFTPPESGGSAFDEYVSDPAKPVPFRARPVLPVGYEAPRTWPQWLVDDQREESGRPDVLAFVSEVLKEPMKISGQPVVH
ncbi:MAG: CocE/NonD family hydrolase, partial [Terriglobia bacterium]